MNVDICNICNCTTKNKCCNPIHWSYNFLLFGGKPQWKTLEHNGPMFPPDYNPHNIPILINKKKYNLSPLAEEFATIYSKYIGTAYVENNTFNKNFWNDYKKILPSDISILIKSITDIDFSLIYNHLIEESEKKKLYTKEEKEKIKIKQEEYEKKFKFCKIDGNVQSVGNYKIEPPGIFLGRGVHPKLGKIKKRVYPEDVIINITKGSTPPTPNLTNHKWKDIIHDNSVVWLSSWKDPITSKNKYIFTSFDSLFKSKSDESKFDIARKLKKVVKNIRNKYMSELNDKNEKNKQLATSLYLIDNLALRIGNSKNTKETADTVGVTSLRVEHITLLDNYVIKLDFLSKDSVRYCNKLKIDETVYNNIKSFITNKSKSEKLFDLINPTMLNEYLSNFMKNLTSKVWRTYNASETFQKELLSVKNNNIINKMDKNERINYLITLVNKANASVAILCNHQKNITTSSENQFEKIDEQIKKLKEQKNKLDDKEKIKVIDNKIIVLKLKKKHKKDSEHISLGTSKNNYIDPRIVFAFAKKYNIPIDKIMNKASLKRFEWANQIDEKYEF